MGPSSYVVYLLDSMSDGNHSITLFIIMCALMRGVLCILDCSKAIKLSEQCLKQDLQVQEIKKLLKAVSVKSAVLALMGAVYVVINFVCTLNHQTLPSILPLALAITVGGYWMYTDVNKSIDIIEEGVLPN